MSFVNGVDVVIVTYNSEKFIEHCLLSIINSKEININKVIVVDNGSSDGTLDAIQRFYSRYYNKLAKLKVIKLKKNLGFPFACNLGVSDCESEYILIVNPDVVLDAYCLTELYRTLSSSKDVAVVQPKILCLSINSHGQYTLTRIVNSAGGFMDLLGHGFHEGYGKIDQGQFNKPKKIMFATFACAMIRRGHYLSLNGMNANYFLYNEDLDFCWRCWLAGFKVIYVPRAVAYHLGEHATRKKPYVSLYFGRRNRLLMIYTNYPLLLSVPITMFLVALYFLADIKTFINKKELIYIRLTMKLLEYFFRGIRLLNKRRALVKFNKNIRVTDLIRMRLIKLKLIGLILFLFTERQR